MVKGGIHPKAVEHRARQREDCRREVSLRKWYAGNGVVVGAGGGEGG